MFETSETEVKGMVTMEKWLKARKLMENIWSVFEDVRVVKVRLSVDGKDEGKVLKACD